MTWAFIPQLGLGSPSPDLGDCQEPPMYTELMEGLSSKCKVIIPDFLI